MAALTRIFSDIHYGDRASTVRSLAQLRPLLDGPDQLILNGDTLDTRLGPNPDVTVRVKADVTAFFSQCGPAVTFLTGNHDPDFSAHHTLDLAGGRVFVTHGDIIFDNIVPWSRDSAIITARVNAGIAALSPAERTQLDPRLGVFRRVCASIPQRHQSEPDLLKYCLRLAADTVWPPTRALSIVDSWRQAPALAAALTTAHRPAAKFVLIGHLHRPGIWPMRKDPTVINTGSFTRPFGARVVDLTDGKLTVRRIDVRRGEFHPGETLAEFPLH